MFQMMSVTQSTLTAFSLNLIQCCNIVWAGRNVTTQLCECLKRNVEVMWKVTWRSFDKVQQIRLRKMKFKTLLKDDPCSCKKYIYIRKPEKTWPSVTHRNSPLFYKTARWCVTVGETVTMIVCVVKRWGFKHVWTCIWFKCFRVCMRRPLFNRTRKYVTVLWQWLLKGGQSWVRYYNFVFLLLNF